MDKFRAFKYDIHPDYRLRSMDWDAVLPVGAAGIYQPFGYQPLERLLLLLDFAALVNCAVATVWNEVESGLSEGKS